jgi:hypothetical protein
LRFEKNGTVTGLASMAAIRESKRGVIASHTNLNTQDITMAEDTVEE